jgi:hypothetical protein
MLVGSVLAADDMDACFWIGLTMQQVEAYHLGCRQRREG